MRYIEVSRYEELKRFICVVTKKEQRKYEKSEQKMFLQLQDEKKSNGPQGRQKSGQEEITKIRPTL